MKRASTVVLVLGLTGLIGLIGLGGSRAAAQGAPPPPAPAAPAALAPAQTPAASQAPASSPAPAASSAEAPQSSATTRAPEVATTQPYAERMTAEGPVMRLSIKDALDLALQNNLDIILEADNQRLARERITGAEGFYDPVIALSTGMRSATRPRFGSASGNALLPDHEDSVEITPGYRQNFKGGTSARVSVTADRATAGGGGADGESIYSSGLAASVTQPLLRGFLRTSAGRQIDLSRLDATISASQFRLTVTDVVQQVLNQYWELVFAIDSYEALRQSKGLAQAQLESTALRVQSGLLSPIALTAARAEIASRDRDLLQAEVEIINAGNALKLLLSRDPASPIWETALVPTDRPVADPVPMTLAQAIDTARARRPELEQLRVQQQQNRIDQQFFKREKLPSVDVTASLFSAGLGRKTGAGSGIGGAGDVTPLSLGGFGRVWRQAFGFDYLTWSASVDVEIPLGNREARAQFAQSLIAGRQLDTQMTKALQSVVVDVRAAFEVIATRRKSLEAARLTTALFEEQLEGETARYDAGFSSAFELLRHQRDVVDAKVQELRATIDLQIATVSLERAIDTLLDTSGVKLPHD